MKKIIIVTSLKQLAAVTMCISIICFISILLFWIFHTNDQFIQVAEEIDDNHMEKIKIENKRLQGALDNIFPKEDKIIYENYSRTLYEDKHSYATYPISNVSENGSDIPFDKVFDDSDYLRPIYDSFWQRFYFRGWLGLSDKTTEAKHRLFIYYGGGSNIFDFEGSLGFSSKGATVDYHNNINLLIFKFDVHQVKAYENQLVLIGEPSRTGAEIISIKLSNLMPKDINSKEFLFQLSTPNGYEIDYLYGKYYTSDFYKKSYKSETIMAISNNSNLAYLQEENSHLKKELSFYVPLDHPLYITEEKCRDIYSNSIDQSIYKIKECGTQINYSINYQNIDYKRPLYDPSWKDNYTKGWAYIPDKICDYMHDLFIIPPEKKSQNEFFGKLAFHEDYQPDENAYEILIYNFIPEDVMVLDNQIIIMGIPSRTGASIISLDKAIFKTEEEYLIQLVTPDSLEVDYLLFRF